MQITIQSKNITVEDVQEFKDNIDQFFSTDFIGVIEEKKGTIIVKYYEN